MIVRYTGSFVRAHQASPSRSTIYRRMIYFDAWLMGGINVSKNFASIKSFMTVDMIMGSVVDGEHEEDRDVEGVLSLLKSVAQPYDIPQSVLRDREAYEERLLTFQVTTYCAKPACLSPIVCARYG